VWNKNSSARFGANGRCFSKNARRFAKASDSFTKRPLFCINIQKRIYIYIQPFFHCSYILLWINYGNYDNFFLEKYSILIWPQATRCHLRCDLRCHYPTENLYWLSAS